ncbi:hypothetical protein D3C79_874120 [compost metagenome]
MRKRPGARPLGRVEPIPCPVTAAGQCQRQCLLLLPALFGDARQRFWRPLIVALVCGKCGLSFSVGLTDDGKLIVVSNPNVIFPERLLRQELAERLGRLGLVHSCFGPDKIIWRHMLDVPETQVRRLAINAQLLCELCPKCQVDLTRVE